MKYTVRTHFYFQPVSLLYIKSVQLTWNEHCNPNTVEPRYNEPLDNEDLKIANDFPYPSNSKEYGKVPDVDTSL